MEGKRGNMKGISRKLTRGVLISGIVFAGISSFAKGTVKPNVVYGNDDRLDVYQVSDPNLLNIAAATAAIMPNYNLASVDENKVAIKSNVFGEDYGLCKDEPFYSQPNPAICSAFLVGPDLVATAGHCINEFSCLTNSFVFDFKMNGPTDAPNMTSRENVYTCKRVVARELTHQQDYSLVQLDRPVTNRNVLTLSQRPASVGDSLVMIGHPAGLPTKIAAGATVRRSEQGYFVANTDSYGGNSGSAVFNASTYEVVGILVRGEQDFTFDPVGMCTRTNYCKDDECRGEDITHIDYVAKAIANPPVYPPPVVEPVEPDPDDEPGIEPEIPADPEPVPAPIVEPVDPAPPVVAPVPAPPPEPVP